MAQKPIAINVPPGRELQDDSTLSPPTPINTGGASWTRHQLDEFHPNTEFREIQQTPSRNLGKSDYFVPQLSPADGEGRHVSWAIAKKKQTAEKAYKEEDTMFHFEDDNEEEPDKPEVKFLRERLEVARVLKKHTVFEMLPKSGKVVILDAELSAGQAFVALNNHGVHFAPLFDSKSKSYMGLLTATDFIDILRHYYRESASHMSIEENLEDQTLRDWTLIEREGSEMKQQHPNYLISVKPETNLYEAVRVMISRNIRRVAVIDPCASTCFLGVAKSTTVTETLIKQLGETPPIMDKSILELGIGTFSHVATIREDTSVITALNLLSARRIGALPIVDSDGKLIAVYNRKSVMLLASGGKFHNLDVPCLDILRDKRSGPQLPLTALTCLRTDTLEEVLLRMLTRNLFRLVCVNEERHVLGIISVSDVLSYFLVLGKDAPFHHTLHSRNKESFHTP